MPAIAVSIGAQAQELIEAILPDLLAHPLQPAQDVELGHDLRRHAALKRSLRQLDEPQNDLKHRGLPFRRAIAIDWRERGLAQEEFVDELRAQQRELLCRWQCILADDPCHPFKIGLAFQKR